MTSLNHLKDYREVLLISLYSGMAYIVFSLLKYGLYGMVSRIIQALVNLFYGPYRAHKNANGILCYEILYDWKSSPFQGAGSHLFTLKFSQVKDISWIDREDVSLYSVTKDEYLFVRSQEGSDIYNAEKHPFLYVSKHNSAVEFGRVAHGVVRDYLRTCGRLTRDGGNVSILHSFGRCGSTLVTNMINKTKQCKVLSEPQALFDVMNITTRMGIPITRDATEYYDLVRETLTLLTPDTDTRYFIKTHSQIIYLIPLFHVLFPGMREAYMYRSIRPTATSFLRAFSDNVPFIFVEKMFIPIMPKELQNVWNQNRVSDHEYGTLFFILGNLYMYFKEVEDRTDIRSFSYESLVADSKAFSRELFYELGIGQSYIDLAVTALESDSQANSCLSRSKVAQNNVAVSEEALIWAKKIGSELGILLEGDKYSISNIPHAWDAEVVNPSS